MDIHARKLIANAKHQDKTCPNTCYLGTVINLAENLDHRLEHATEQFNHAQKCIAGMVYYLIGPEPNANIAIQEYESYRDHPILEKDTPRIKSEPNEKQKVEENIVVSEFEQLMKAMREQCLFSHDDFRGETMMRVPDHLMKDFDSVVHICPNMVSSKFKESDSDKMIRALNMNLAAAGVDPNTIFKESNNGRE